MIKVKVIRGREYSSIKVKKFCLDDIKEVLDLDQYCVVDVETDLIRMVGEGLSDIILVKQLHVR